MKDIKLIKRCPRCGVIIQSADRNLPGYVNEHYYRNIEVVLCETCFFEQKKVEEEALRDPEIDEEYLKIFRHIRKENAIVIYVIDLFLIQSTFSKEISDTLNDLDMIAVLTKQDLFNFKTHEEVMDFAKKRLDLGGLKPKEIIVADKKEDYNIGDINKLITKYEKVEKRNVYLIGTASSGKSSIFNTYLKKYSNKTDKNITTTPFLNTKIRVMSVPLDNKYFLYDLPGYVLENSVLATLDKANRRLVLPTIQVTPQTHSVLPKTSFILGGIARIDFVAGKRTNLNFYFSRAIEIKKYPLAAADKQFSLILKSGKAKPSSKAVISLDDLIAYEVQVKNGAQSVDVGIVGLGFIRFKAENQVLRLLVPKKVGIYSTYQEEDEDVE